jgi:hypothetical protein
VRTAALDPFRTLVIQLRHPCALGAVIRHAHRTRPAIIARKLCRKPAEAHKIVRALLK